MNQEQRKFLIEHTKQTHKRQIDMLNNKRPQRPSLNNYLVAACLDGSIEFNSIESIKNKIRGSVLSFGADDMLVHEEYRRYNYDETSGKRYVKLPPEDIFIMPKAYQEALDAYLKTCKELDDEIGRLNAMLNTILLKLNVGSNAHLERLIEQVDNLAELNIINTQLLLK